MHAGLKSTLRLSLRYTTSTHGRVTGSAAYHLFEGEAVKHAQVRLHFLQNFLEQRLAVQWDAVDAHPCVLKLAAVLVDPGRAHEAHRRSLPLERLHLHRLTKCSLLRIQEQQHL